MNTWFYLYVKAYFLNEKLLYELLKLCACIQLLSARRETEKENAFMLS